MVIGGHVCVKRYCRAFDFNFEMHPGLGSVTGRKVCVLFWSPSFYIFNYCLTRLPAWSEFRFVSGVHDALLKLAYVQSR